MVIGKRLRELREQRGLSQGHIEKRTGLLRCYVSRVEGGYTTPSVQTLEKFARALEVPMYQLLYDGDGAPERPRHVPKREPKLWGSAGKDAVLLESFRKVLEKMKERDRQALMLTARKMQNGRRSHPASKSSR